MKNINLKQKTVSLLIVALFTSIILYAYGSGQAGATLKSSQSGCMCHTSAVTTAVQVIIAGPAVLQPGATGTYTVTISGGSGTAVGVDIASSSGTLSTVDGNLKISSGELVHTSKKAFTSGRYVFNFNFTAPSATGPVTLYATGCSTKPQWNFAQNFPLNVATGVEENSLPREFSLSQNYPNPFNPSTKIKFSLKESGNVKLSVYDLNGKLVDVIINNENRPSGIYEIEYNASKLSSGVYYYTLASGQNILSKKFVVLK